ncbi:hypothetical protein ACVWWP_000416 [Bradyrhizobium sp. LM3.6]
MKNADGYNTCGEANQTGEHDKAPIMLCREAGKNAEHRNRLRRPISPMVDGLNVLRVNLVQLLIACLAAG